MFGQEIESDPGENNVGKHLPMLTLEGAKSYSSNKYRMFSMFECFLRQWIFSICYNNGSLSCQNSQKSSEPSTFYSPFKDELMWRKNFFAVKNRQIDNPIMILLYSVLRKTVFIRIWSDQNHRKIKVIQKGIC